MTRIAIADDHAVVRRGLKAMLDDVPEFTVAGEAGSADDLLTLLRSRPFDVVILDLALGTRSGLEILKHIRSEFPRLPVLILSMHDEELYAIRVLKAGAAGYVQKAGAPEELIRAIRAIASGRTYVSPALTERITADIARGQAEVPPHERLSDREFEVFRLLGTGMTVTDIARNLNLSVKTISTHRTRILGKTGMQTNADIVQYVTTHQLGGLVIASELIHLL